MLNPNLSKVRPTDVLGNLSESEQQRVLDWCETLSYHAALAEIAKPAPEGLGLKIGYTSLRNFYLKHLPLRLALQRRESAGDWKVLTEQAKLEPIDFETLIRQSIEKEVLMGLLATGAHEPGSHNLLKILLRWRAQEIARARENNRSAQNPTSVGTKPVR